LKSLLISFSGIDGAGKSTQIEKLRRYLEDANLPVRSLTFWDDVAVFSGLRAGFSRYVLQSDGTVGSPERPAKRRDKNAQSWPLLLGRSVVYLLDVIKLRRVVREARSHASVVIFDRYIYDQLAALPLESRLARAYTRLVLGIAPRLDLSYLLDAVPEDARVRKPEYPLEFLRKNRSSYLRLRSMAELDLIPAADASSVHDVVIEQFKKLVASAPGELHLDSAVIA
jgi:thymidylate kinase